MEPITFVGFPKIARLNREIVISEKIDGTNAQIYIVNRAEVLADEISNPTAPFMSVSNELGDFIILAGSRNGWVSAAKDNYGFGRWVSDNRDELLKLGPGHHFGEWWGAGIQRRYGQAEKHFSLFNVSRWFTDRTVPGVIEKKETLVDGQRTIQIIGPGPACCGVVPILYRGPFNPLKIVQIVEMLRNEGSVAAPGFDKPEGIVVYHTAANVSFKVTLENDDQHKGSPQ